MNTLSIEKFVIDTSPIVKGEKVSLRTVFNRYRLSSGEGIQRGKKGTVFFLVHGGGHHKEMWEPTLIRLFETLSSTSGDATAEAWTFDCPNHGESWSLNKDVFTRLLFPPIYESAETFSALYSSSHFKDFDKALHKLVILGHSGGAVISILTTQYFPGPPDAVPISAIVLIEPAMTSVDMIGHEPEMYKIVQAMTPNRVDTWESREVARAWLQKRPPWKAWDPRILDLYVKHGLTEHSDPAKGVTLTTPKSEEARVFKGTAEALDALNRVNQLARAIPVHFIFGDREELYTKDIQKKLNNPAEGRKAASMTWIPKAGHLVVQEAPDKLADAISAILGDEGQLRNLL